MVLTYVLSTLFFSIGSNRGCLTRFVRSPTSELRKLKGSWVETYKDSKVGSTLLSECCSTLLNDQTLQISPVAEWILTGLLRGKQET